jgi:hypothetical protein
LHRFCNVYALTNRIATPPSVTDAIDEMLAQAALPRWRERTAAMRAQFEARTGAFSSRDPFFEARSAAFWDDALTRGAFGRELGSALSPGAHTFIEPLARAHRGLFRVETGFLLVDEWSGAELVVTPTTTGLRDALDRASGSLVDGRVVGARQPVRTIALLPGAVFHAPDALEPIRALLPAARKTKWSTHDVLDALLRMDHALRSLSRVKAAFAYRREALKPI